MIPRLVLSVVVLFVSAVGLAAQSRAEFDRLFDLLELPAYLEIVSAEGAADAFAIEQNMFPGRGGSAWRSFVSDLYAPDRVEKAFKDSFVGAMAGVDLDPIFAFYDTQMGVRIIAGELRARQGMRSALVERAAIEDYADLVGEADPLRELIAGFIDANDLIERNVTGSLNTNFAFLNGMAQNEIFAQDLTQSEIISRVYDQEGEIRLDATNWLQAYLLLAFSDLADGDAEAYIAHSLTPAGRAFNSAVFTAFDTLYESISFRLGRAAADFIAGQDL